MIEIKPQNVNEEIKDAVDDDITPADSLPSETSGVIGVPQEMLEHFNIKPEDTVSMEDRYRLQEIFLLSKKLFPEGNTGAILRFIHAVEVANPSYGASETERLFNVYKNFKLANKFI